MLALGFLRKLFGGGKGKAGTLKGKPITCLSCTSTFAIKSFSKLNGICNCGGGDFSFLTDDVPDDELAANKNISAGAKFVLDADDHHLAKIEGRKLILYLRNQGLM